jgi:FkbM family methyltransferase
LSQTKSLAYDVGMNNGDDTDYYLRKGYHVIGIEANPELCVTVSNRFAEEIRKGLLTLLNVGVARQDDVLDFYLDTWAHTTSTFVPQPNHHNRYRVIPVTVQRLSSIIVEYGVPDLLKLDVEGLDFPVLQDLYANEIRVRFISAEAHTIDVFCMLVCMGYDQFKVIDSGRVAADFPAHPVTALDGHTFVHQFENNSSGPFGDDLPSPWQDKNATMAKLATFKETWRDVQAKNNRQVLLHEARLANISNPECEVEKAYSYWRRYPDVANDSHYGRFGDLGVAGARRHFEEHGRKESKRQWEP